MKLRKHMVWALFLRHLYPLQRDFDLLSDMIYWPIIDTLLWGVTGQWLAQSSGGARLVVSILSGLLLWNVIWRSQAEVARNLMDEIWNNNLVNLFSTPLTITEWVVSVILLSIGKTVATVSMLSPIMYLLYRINVLEIGPWLGLFFIGATMTGWWVGFLAAGIVLRKGPKVQTVIWTLPGILLPFSAIYFPITQLPLWARWISYLVPTSYIFETMRSVLNGMPVDLTLLLISFLLNSIYLFFSVWFFVRSFKYSLNLGLGRFN
ncbi:ABC transporter permease [Candidatus Woesebacteria bacterium]|nr:ABC transporter permease [Candidatus Woesebacteria bacterium]